MSYPVSGAGLGLRRSLLDSLSDQRVDAPISFMEVAPENWINVGGAFGRKFRAYTERFPFVCHGLSLSLGGYTPLDETLLRKVRAFLDEHGVRCYSEHLSYCSDDGHLYDLMPIPFTEDATKRVSERIQRAQDILGRRIAVENVSFYAPLATDMSELEFFCEVVERADCQILLDVNNVYVNSINHRYDPRSFIESIPGKRIAYLHIAGHYDEAEDLKVDTHGADVIDPVWALLRHAYATWGVIPTLLERDFNIPAVAELLSEVEQVRAIQEDFTEPDQQRERLG